MMLLNFLVSSKTRRCVLATLLGHSEGLTVSELSRLAGVPYSGAYKEVGRMRQANLVRTRTVGSAVLCEWKPPKHVGRLMKALVAGESSDTGDPTGAKGTRHLPAHLAKVQWNLKRWKAPLVDPGEPGPELSLEETLAQAVELSRWRTEVARVWPVVLARHRTQVDLGKLVAAGRRHGQKRALGFLLSLAGVLLGDPVLSRHAEGLRDNRWRMVRDYFQTKRGEHAQALAEKRTPALARQWLFRMNMTMDAFESFFKKYQKLNAKV